LPLEKSGSSESSREGFDWEKVLPPLEPQDAVLKLARCKELCHCSSLRSSCLYHGFETLDPDGAVKCQIQFMIDFFMRLHEEVRRKTTTERRLLLRELYEQHRIKDDRDKALLRQEFEFKIYSSEMKKDVKVCRQVFEFCYGFGAGTFARLTRQVKMAYDDKPTLYKVRKYNDRTFPAVDMITSEDIFVRNCIRPGKYVLACSAWHVL